MAYARCVLYIATIYVIVYALLVFKKAARAGKAVDGTFDQLQIFCIIYFISQTLLKNKVRRW